MGIIKTLENLPVNEPPSRENKKQDDTKDLVACFQKCNLEDDYSAHFLVLEDDSDDDTSSELDENDENEEEDLVERGPHKYCEENYIVLQPLHCGSSVTHFDDVELLECLNNELFRANLLERLEKMDENLQKPRRISNDSAYQTDEYEGGFFSPSDGSLINSPLATISARDAFRNCLDPTKKKEKWVDVAQVYNNLFDITDRGESLLHATLKNNDPDKMEKFYAVLEHMKRNKKQFPVIIALKDSIIDLIERSPDSPCTLLPYFLESISLS